nr:DUF2795 domain-containing protein [Methanolobus sp.]
MEYPKAKKDILDYARSHNASENIVSDLQDIPDKQYMSPADIKRAFSESRSEAEVPERLEEDIEKIDRDMESWKKQ